MNTFVTNLAVLLIAAILFASISFLVGILYVTQDIPWGSL